MFLNSKQVSVFKKVVIFCLIDGLNAFQLSTQVSMTTYLFLNPALYFKQMENKNSKILRLNDIILLLHIFFVNLLSSRFQVKIDG